MIKFNYGDRAVPDRLHDKGSPVLHLRPQTYGEVSEVELQTVHRQIEVRGARGYISPEIS